MSDVSAEVNKSVQSDKGIKVLTDQAEELNLTGASVNFTHQIHELETKRGGTKR